LPAGAQITTQTQLQLVAAVPFQNLAKGGPEVLGEQATNAVTQALLDTQVYDVRPIEESKQKMADMGLRAPLTEAELNRLGEAMGVGGVVFGEVRTAGVRKLTRSSQGEVTLMVAIYDVATGTIRNGTITTGRSSFSSGEVSEEKLVDEALNQAAYQSVKEIRSNRPITGIVQSADGKEVAISVGSSSGVRPTMKFVVLRSGQRVGVLKIGKVEQIFSDAQLLEGQARTGDRIVQVFEIPAKGTVVEVPGVKEEKKESFGKLALAVLAGLVLAGMSRSSGGGSATENVTAAAISNVVDTGIYTTPDTRGDALGLFTLDGGGAAVQIRWAAPKAGSDVLLGYEIWEDSQFLWFTQGIGDAGRIFNLPNSLVGGLAITLEIDPDSGVGTITGNDGLDPESFEKDETPSATAPGYVANDVHPTQIDYNCYTPFVLWVQEVPTGEGDETDDIGFTFWLGPAGGSRHVYQVRKVVSRRYQLADGTFQWEIVRETLPGRSVVVTFVAPPELQLPAPNELVADPTAVTFGFNPPPGVDDFILQVSLGSQFLKGSTGVDNLTLLDGLHSSSELLLTTKNLESLVGSLPSGTTVFWRVGARWLGDTTMPMPYPKVGKAPTDPYRYVFSEPRQIVMP